MPSSSSTISSEAGGIKPGSSAPRRRWDQVESKRLEELVKKFGSTGRAWSEIAQHLPGRTRKQCRCRWVNMHSSVGQVKKGNWSTKEEFFIMTQHSLRGPEWSRMSRQMAGRTESSVKNHWNAVWRSKTLVRPHSPLWQYVKQLKAGLSPKNAFHAALREWNRHGATTLEILESAQKAATGLERSPGSGRPATGSPRQHDASVEAFLSLARNELSPDQGLMQATALGLLNYRQHDLAMEDVSAHYDDEADEDDDDNNGGARDVHHGALHEQDEDDDDGGDEQQQRWEMLATTQQADRDAKLGVQRDAQLAPVPSAVTLPGGPTCNAIRLRHSQQERTTTTHVLAQAGAPLCVPATPVQYAAVGEQGTAHTLWAGSGFPGSYPEPQQAGTNQAGQPQGAFAFVTVLQDGVTQLLPVYAPTSQEVQRFEYVGSQSVGLPPTPQLSLVPAPGVQVSVPPSQHVVGPMSNSAVVLPVGPTWQAGGAPVSVENLPMQLAGPDRAGATNCYVLQPPLPPPPTNNQQSPVMTLPQIAVPAVSSPVQTQPEADVPPMYVIAAPSLPQLPVDRVCGTPTPQAPMVTLAPATPVTPGPAQYTVQPTTPVQPSAAADSGALVLTVEQQQALLMQLLSAQGVRVQLHR